MVSAGLPAVSAGLPVVSASLPVPAAHLPAVAAGLPVAASALPALARGFGEIDLPNVAEILPTAQSADQQMPARPSGHSGAFGEIELPRERATSSAPPAPGGHNSADFGDLELGDKPRPRPGASAPSRGSTPRARAVGG